MVDADPADSGVLTDAQRTRRGWVSGTVGVICGFLMAVPASMVLPWLSDTAHDVDEHVLIAQAGVWVVLGLVTTFAGLWAAGRQDGRLLLVAALLAMATLLVSVVLNGSMVLAGVPVELAPHNLVTLPAWFLALTNVGPCVLFAPLPLLSLVAAVSLLRR